MAGLVVPDYFEYYINWDKSILSLAIFVPVIISFQTFLTNPVKEFNKVKDKIIYEHALSAGAQLLQGLFELMEVPGTRPISTVIIEPAKYFLYKLVILEDARIDSSEFSQIRKLIKLDT